MNLTELTRQNLRQMTKSERAVANCFFQKPDAFLFETLDLVAHISDVSTTTVLRFCRRLGFSGFKDFQGALRSSSAMHPSLPQKFSRNTNENQSSLLSRSMAQGILCIQESFKNWKDEDFSRAVKALTGARRVYTFGMKESSALAHYAYTRLLAVRGDVFLLSSPSGNDPEGILDLTEEDVCLFFLFHRYTKISLEIFKFLSKKKIPLILITDPPYPSCIRENAVSLPCRVDAGGIKNTYASPLILCDALCNAAASEGGEKTLKHMKRCEDLFREINFVEEY